ncbi:MAG TPA: tetratricopeptide repeat protein [Bacteroidales bacterium]|nr:tetratricopeptide repeat protein [Bacteroidales bacterium]
MKNITITLLLLIIVLNIFANDIKTESDSALNYYLNSDFEKALAIYEDINSKGYCSADLFFNMGNCYYNLGDLANAIYFYEKAIVLNPSDEDILHNLQIANSKIKNKTDIVPEVFYLRWYKSIVSLFSTDKWAILSIIFFILCLGTISLYLFSKRIILRKTGFYSAILLFILSIFSLIFSIGQAKLITNNNFAIIFETSLVKSGPSDESTNLFEVNEGLKVEITDSLNSWYNVKLADGKQGWIIAENVKKI